MIAPSAIISDNPSIISSNNISTLTVHSPKSFLAPIDLSIDNNEQSSQMSLTDTVAERPINKVFLFNYCLWFLFSVNQIYNNEFFFFFEKRKQLILVAMNV